MALFRIRRRLGLALDRSLRQYNENNRRLLRRVSCCFYLFLCFLAFQARNRGSNNCFLFFVFALQNLLYSCSSFKKHVDDLRRFAIVAAINVVKAQTAALAFILINIDFPTSKESFYLPCERIHLEPSACWTVRY